MCLISLAKLSIHKPNLYITSIVGHFVMDKKCSEDNENCDLGEHIQSYPGFQLHVNGVKVTPIDGLMNRIYF